MWHGWYLIGLVAVFLWATAAAGRLVVHFRRKRKNDENR